MDEQLIRETYAKLPTDDLLVVIASRNGYTAPARRMAMEELKHRQVSDEDIKAFKRDYSSLEQIFGIQNITEDLSIPQKLFFYFLWLPRFSGWLRLEFSTEGFILKTWQSNYYSFAGFIGFILSLAAVSSSIGGALVICTVLFMLVFAFDTLYNLNRQRRKLSRLESEGRLHLEW